jgi:DNA-binding transcriptional MerR regulator/methylmalonyl-CoA mutase cobalamin-binding subunit
MHSVSSAARLCGVSPSTLRAWERRYGVVEPIRTEGGYRVYDDAALRRLTRMSSLIASGWSPRHAAAYVMNENGEGESLPAGTAVEEARPDPVPPTPEEEAEHIEVILQAAEALDAPRVSDELDFVFSIHAFDDLVDNWLGPVLAATGQAWQSGRLSVAGEHFLTAGIERRLSHYFEEAGQSRGTGPRVVVGLPRGARHAIGSFAFATSLRRNGCQVTYLGADVPTDAWLHAVESTHADAVCLSVPTADDALAASETVAAITLRRPAVAVYVGGSGSHAVTASGATRLEGSVSAAAQRILADHAETSAAGVPEAEAAAPQPRVGAPARVGV